MSGLTQPFFVLQIKNGSLLNRPKAVLQKLAAMSDLNPNAPRNSRNFVFHTLSPDKSEEAKEKSKLQVNICVGCAAGCVDCLHVQTLRTAEGLRALLFEIFSDFSVCALTPNNSLIVQNLNFLEILTVLMYLTPCR